MMRYLFRVPRFAVLIAIVGIPLLSGIVFSPYAPWNDSGPKEPSPFTVRSGGVTWVVDEKPRSAYVWEKADFSRVLARQYSFSIRGGKLSDKVSRLWKEVTAQTPGGVRHFVWMTDMDRGKTPGNDVVGRMSLERAIQMLFRKTGCVHEVADVSMLTMYCAWRPELYPETPEQFAIESSGEVSVEKPVACDSLNLTDPNIPAPDSRFDIPAGDASQTVSMWLDVVKDACRGRSPELLWSPVSLSGHRTNAIKGRYSLSFALKIMLENSGLRLEPPPGAWAVVQASETNERPGSTGGPG